MNAPSLGALFRDRVARSGPRPAQQVKRDGRWVDATWSQVGEEVQEVARGLVALGRHRGDAIGLVSQTRAEWVRADMAILSLGAVTVPVYPSYPAEALAYIVNDAEVRTLIVEDAAQLAKATAAGPDMPGLESIVVMTSDPAPSGVATSRPRIVGWEELRGLGRSGRAAGQAALAAALRDVGPDDVATIVYTSGTTGHPKGVVQTHGNHLAALESVRAVMGLHEGDVHLLFLPLAHSFGRLEAFSGIHEGLVTAFAESIDRLAENLREVRPDFICSVPRVFEKVYAKILAGVAGAPPLRRKIFHWAVGVGRRVSACRSQHRAIPAFLRLQHALATRLVYGKIKAAMGGRLRVCFSGGAPLAKEIAEFFDAVGVTILEGYGLTETCPILSANRPDAFRFGTVGQPYPGVTLRLAEDGEILARGANIAKGYHRRPEETAAVFGADGWFHTGDIGELDAQGFLRITDRKKDLIKTAGGSYVAPQHVENLLKADPLVSQALVYGDRRPYPVALITLQPDDVLRLGREAGLAGRPAAEVVQAPAVVARVKAIVDATNQHLASYAQIKRFAVLPVDFSQETGELTPTLKLKRRDVCRKYEAILEELYRDPAGSQV